MKVLNSFLVGFALIASVLADYATDARINQTYVGFMQHFESLVNKTSYETAVAAYKSQQKAIGSNADSKGYSFEQLLQLSNNATSGVMAHFRPIAYRIIYDAGYNTKGNYYIMNSTSNVWHLPNQAPPANPINGTAVNSQILGKELQSAFVQLLPREDGLQKRFLGRIFTTSNVNNFVRNVEPLPPTEIKVKVEGFEQANPALGRKDKNLMESTKKSVDDQIEWRKDASTELKADLDEMDQNPGYYSRKETLEGIQKKLGGKKDKTESDKKDMDVVQKELNKINGLISKDLGQMWKWRISRIISLFFMGLGGMTFFSILFYPGPPTDANLESEQNLGFDDFDSVDVPTQSAGGFSEPSIADFDETGLNDDTKSSSEVSETSAVENSSSISDQTLAKIIRNPETGITYYLDEATRKYYYVDPKTNQSVYYSS